MDRLELKEYVKTLAEEFATRIKEGDSYFEALNEICEASEYVIYYTKAWELVAYARMEERDSFDDAEFAFSERYGLPKGATIDFDNVMCSMAFFVLRHMVEEYHLAMEEALKEYGQLCDILQSDTFKNFASDDLEDALSKSANDAEEQMSKGNPWFASLICDQAQRRWIDQMEY